MSDAKPTFPPLSRTLQVATLEQRMNQETASNYRRAFAGQIDRINRPILVDKAQMAAMDESESRSLQVSLND